MEKICGNCKWWVVTGYDKSNNQCEKGYCKKYPKREEKDSDDWCSKFKKENRLTLYPSPLPPPSRKNNTFVDELMRPVREAENSRLQRNNLLNVCENAVNEFTEWHQHLPVGNENHIVVTKITAIMSKIQHAINLVEKENRIPDCPSPPPPPPNVDSC